MWRVQFTAFLLLALCVLPACSGDNIDGCYSVEVALGKFLPVKFSKWSSRDMVVQYSNRVVKWRGPIELNPPQTLMEFEGKLYLLALDAKRGRPRSEWRYRAFRQEGETFKEIPMKDFPRSIAVFNLWRPGDPSRYSTGMEGEKVDAAKLSRELDPEARYFGNSYQARLWYMLEVENNLYKAESEFFYGDDRKKFLREFIAKHKPVRLTSMEMKPLPKGECKF